MTDLQRDALLAVGVRPGHLDEDLGWYGAGGGPVAVGNDRRAVFETEMSGFEDLVDAGDSRPQARSPGPARRPLAIPAGDRGSHGHLGCPGERPGGDRVTTGDDDNDDEIEQEDLGAQMGVAADAIRAAALRLLREGEVHPWVVVLAAARVAGELGASAALAGGQAHALEPVSPLRLVSRGGFRPVSRLTALIGSADPLRSPVPASAGTSPAGLPSASGTAGASAGSIIPNSTSQIFTSTSAADPA